MATIEAKITPAVMEWARKKSGYTPERAARKIGRPSEDIRAWETGELKPTLAQARKASGVYKRPLAVFFLPEPPKEFDTLRDFRTLPEGVPEEYSPELSFLIRRLQSRQQWMREFLETEEYEPVDFIGSGSLSDTPTNLAEKIRKKLAIEPSEVISCRTREEALQLWIDRVEENGIFVSRGGNSRWEKIYVEEARGFVLADKFAPFIFINAQDAKAAQLFTLAHELVHLWINEPGLSNREPIIRPTSDTETIEIFCNKVSSEILVPESLFVKRWQVDRKEKSLLEKINSMSIHFKVSREVITRKLLDRHVINQSKYLDLIKVFRKELMDLKEREKKDREKREGFPDPHRIKLMNNGMAFTRIVLSAYKSGEILGSETAGLLEIKLNYLPKIADFVGLPFPLWGEAE
jgi:Zn-dependent peptidase ImmA (M78 family)/DNA-binding XRE family transcriptional regulator